MSSTDPSFSVPSTTSSSVSLYLYTISFSFALFVFLFLPSALDILRGTGNNVHLRATSKLIFFPLLSVQAVNDVSINFYYLDVFVLLDCDCFQSFAECFIVVSCYSMLLLLLEMVLML